MTVRLIAGGILFLLIFGSVSSLQVTEYGFSQTTMSLTGNSFGVPVDQSFDYVIVGGGTAGNTLAARLASDPAGYSVALVEAGTFYQLANGNRTSVPLYDSYSSHPFDQTSMMIDYDIVTEPQVGFNDKALYYSQGRTFGGSSALNYMVYHRPTVESMQMWADAVNDSSYTWDNVFPYYQKSINFSAPDYTKLDATLNIQYNETAVNSTQGMVHVSYTNHKFEYAPNLWNALESIGVQKNDGFNGGELNGYSTFTATVNPHTATRSSSMDCLEVALGQDGFVVYPLTTAKRILFDDNKKATGVQVETQHGSKIKNFTLSANKEVIVSAGAFRSPQLLMVSGIGPSATLRDFNITEVVANEGVGQNIWDQPWFALSFRVNMTTATQIIAQNSNYTVSAVEQYLQTQSGPLSAIGAGDAVAWEKLPEKYRSVLSNSTTSKLSKFPTDWPELELVSVAGGTPPENLGPNDMYMALGAALVAPLSLGNMTIRSNDTNDNPVISPNWFLDPGDQELAIGAFRRVREWAGAASDFVVEEYLPGPNVQSDADILEWLQSNSYLIWHSSAGCAMGSDDNPDAVLDSRARVRGVQGLRVVDASSFPFLPPGHPQSTVYMLAEKISDDILSQS